MLYPYLHFSPHLPLPAACERDQAPDWLKCGRSSTPRDRHLLDFKPGVASTW